MNHPVGSTAKKSTPRQSEHFGQPSWGQKNELEKAARELEAFFQTVLYGLKVPDQARIIRLVKMQKVMGERKCIAR